VTHEDEKSKSDALGHLRRRHARSRPRSHGHCDACTVLAEVDRLRSALESLLRDLPTCDGEWTAGSGGHRLHGPGCSRIAEWHDSPYNYCDEHCPDRTKHDVEPQPWVDGVRTAREALGR
jgi:hypothetical protein